VYDPRVGRWFARDPLTKKYPYDSPYSFVGNNPITLQDPDGMRKRKMTIVANEQGEIIKVTAKHIDYSLKRQKRYGTDKLSGDATISYDYYDIVDLEIIVVDKNNKILHKSVQKDIKGDLRVKDQHPLMPEAAIKIDDYLFDLPTEKEDNLKGNEKGHFKSGIDFTIDDEGNLLNIRGLEKINSTGNPQVIEISDLNAIMSGNVGGSLTKKLVNIDALDNGVKAMEQVEHTIEQVKKLIKSKELPKKAQEASIKKPDSVTIQTWEKGKLIKIERVPESESLLNKNEKHN
jgi:hypothetical protein